MMDGMKDEQKKLTGAKRREWGWTGGCWDDYQ